MADRQPRMTVPKFAALKGTGRKICMLTAYDYTLARLLDEADVDAILVGDSLAMVVQGRTNTLPVTVDQLIYHAEMVGRAAQRALVIVDMPFPTAHLGPHRAVEIAGRMLKETGCQAVKLEGGADQADTIAALVTAGIPVMGHVGLQPQSVHVLGGHKVQRAEQQMLADALAAQQAGAFAVVVECVPAPLATRLTEQLAIPTIGIGAGAGCDGQVLVTYDLLGLTTGYVPKFVRPFADLKTQIRGAVDSYCRAVRDGSFPAAAETFQ